MTYTCFTNKNHTMSCEWEGFSLFVQIIKQNYTSISIFHTITFSSTLRVF